MYFIGILIFDSFSVTLKKLDSLIKIPTFDSSQNYTDDNDEIETLQLVWQEKRFSQFEIEYYSLIENCKTDEHKKYHDQIKLMNLVERTKTKPRKMFTYIDQDHYHPPNDFKHETASNKTDESDELVCMYVMADLKSVEMLLIKITWNQNENLLITYPDFNDILNNPYLIEIDTDSRDLYHYSMLNMSEGCEIDRKIRDLELFSKLSLDCIRHLEKDDDFIYPTSKFRKNILILFEIAKLEDFENDNCHVRYTIKPPPDCEVNEGILEGSTHSSYRKNRIYLLGHCHELFISMDEKFEGCLKISYEVVSIDYWGRELTEGRSFLSIPLKSGANSSSLVCYRELYRNRFYDLVYRYLFGGRFKFNAIDFNVMSDRISIDGVESVQTLNRYGNNTITTGRINVNYQIITQIHPNLNFMLNAGRKMKSKFDGKVISSIDEIVQSYFEARRRLEEASGE